MNDVADSLSLGAALLAGLVGSAHCFGMCGGLAGALGMRARTMGATPAQATTQAWASQIGRIASYAAIGALVGWAGNGVNRLMQWMHIAVTLRLVAGILLLAIAVRIAFGINLFASIERVGAHLWSHIAPLASAQAAGPVVASGVARALTFGAVWGWLPCGLVYSMAIYAALSGSALRGGLVMFAFGVGTLPSMLASTLLAERLSLWTQRKQFRRVAAALLATFGVWTMVAALMHGAHGSHP